MSLREKAEEWMADVWPGLVRSEKQDPFRIHTVADAYAFGYQNALEWVKDAAAKDELDTDNYGQTVIRLEVLYRTINEEMEAK